MPFLPAAPATAGYMVYYASVSPQTGRMWCPQCTDVEQLVKATFEGAKKPEAHIIYVGQRNEWRTPSHPLRQAPTSITGVPTIVKLDSNGKEVGRLVEENITPSSLEALLAK